MTITDTAVSQTSSQARPCARIFAGAEGLLLALTLAVALVAGVIAAHTEQAVDWRAFMLTFLPSIGLIVAGLYARHVRLAPRLADLAIGNAIYVGFGGVAAILIYLRFPISVPLGDASFAAFDARLGYHWASFNETLAHWPRAAYALGYVYQSSLPQLLVLICFLAITGRQVLLHRALLTGTLGLIFTTLIWWIWPSLGPSAHESIAPGIAERIGLVTDPAFGAGLKALAEDGLAVISPQHIRGTIAFPSYHTIMALLTVWYLRRTALFVPALLLNIAMVPAILSHGGHHLSDMLGGLVFFAIAAWLTAWLVPDPKARRTAPES